jgi:hypothetical protein
MIHATCPVCLKHEFHCNGCGADLTEHIDSLTDKPIRPKDEKMEEPMILSQAHEVYSGNRAKLCLDEAIRVGEEAKRIKAEIAKREEIGPGDWYLVHNGIRQCRERQGFEVIGYDRTEFAESVCKKLHPTPEVKAWLDSLVGGRG